MLTVTHAVTMNGNIHGELKDPDLTPEQDLRRRLGLLDGVERYSFSLWRLPEQVPFMRVNLKTWPQEFVQVAGSRERMTVEVRRFEDQVPRQYVVGHTFPDDEIRSEELIPWDGHEARVFSTEVFTADEAADIFVAYLATGKIPDTYSLRMLRL